MHEKILMEGVTNPLTKKGFATKNGHGVLTNRRFIYSKHSLAKIMAMGILVNATKGSYECEIPLEDIEKAKTGKHMLGYALTITRKDGSVLKYGIMKPLEWQIAFDNALDQETDKGGVASVQDAESQNAPAENKQQSSGKNFCSNCGATLDNGVHFCSNCGAKV